MKNHSLYATMINIEKNSMGIWGRIFDAKNKLYLKNITFSFLFKGLSILSSFIILPLCLSFLSKSAYGVWLTIFSVAGWTTLFDLGLGNGIKNKLSEALVKKNIVSAREIVSTGYFSLLIITLGLTAIFGLVHFLVNWESALNIKQDNIEIDALVFVCIAFFLFRLVVDLITSILLAHQKVAYTNFINCVSNLLTLLLLYLLTVLFHSPDENERLFYLGLTFSAVPVLVLLCFNFYLFRFKFRNITPTYKLFKKRHVRSILSLGGQFFVIQMVTLILFSTDNVLISVFLGQEEVTLYNIVFKLFSGFTIIWGIIIAPYWVAFNEAYVKEDFIWIKKTIKMLLLFWAALVLVVFITVAGAPYIYKIWLGKNDLYIPFILSFFMGVYVIFSTFNNIFAFFLNGVGKVRAQLIFSILVGVINIPLAYFFIKCTNIGTTAIVVANCVCLLIGGYTGPLQYYKIINKKATGIWSK